MNELFLGITVVYGVAFGLRNLLMRFARMFHKREVTQSGFGEALDLLFVVSIIYFATFGFNFMAELANNIYN